MNKQNIITALEKIGVTDSEKQAEFFRALKESAIMDQELDLDELDQVSGGDCSLRDQEADQNCCVKDHFRIKAQHGCAATVESGSGCSNNDECIKYAVVYLCTGNVYDYGT